MTDEASITINGIALTIWQAGTVRVALETLASALNNGLGDDEHGKTMTDGYLEAVQSIRGLMRS